jgi:hypothetical protein
MKGYLIFLAVFLTTAWACGDYGNPVHEQKTVEPPGIPALGQGQASFLLNGTRHDISIFAQRNGYNLNEVVLRGSGKGMENTLILTFRPNEGNAEVNIEMTGYWDLGLCIPFNKYLLSSSPRNIIRVLSYDSGSGYLKAEFDLTFLHESDTTRVASFTDGTFEASVDYSAFTYCIEG